MEDLPLRDAFQRRDKRFQLLDKGIRRAGWHGKSLKILEIGCANGAAAEHLRKEESFLLCSIDLDSAVIAQAAREYPACTFLCADACRLPFAPESFDGLFSEAAFSVIPDKDAAAAEYARVLRPGGRVLINDFILRAAPAGPRASDTGIPCFDGVGTLEEYEAVFARRGLHCLYRKEDYFSFLRIAESLSKCYDVSGAEIGRYIREKFGSDRFVDDFFAQSGMSYAQIILEKDTV
jgi:ubiquinone/menaquinone biosynthesis C-methylase UbiE